MSEITQDMIEAAINAYEILKEDKGPCESTFMEDFWIKVLKECPEVLKDEFDGMPEVMERLILCYKEHGCEY